MKMSLEANSKASGVHEMTAFDRAKVLYAEWKASNFQGSIDKFHSPSEKDIMLNFAEWMVEEKLMPMSKEG